MKNHIDCGGILYDAARQNVKSGGSGPGCCAAVLCGRILPRLERGSYRRVLFIATGALMSQTTFLQREHPGHCASGGAARAGMHCERMMRCSISGRLWWAGSSAWRASF